jgi:hypothetical protein
LGKFNTKSTKYSYNFFIKPAKISENISFSGEIKKLTIIILKYFNILLKRPKQGKQTYCFKNNKLNISLCFFAKKETPERKSKNTTSYILKLFLCKYCQKARLLRKIRF